MKTVNLSKLTHSKNIGPISVLPPSDLIYSSSWKFYSEPICLAKDRDSQYLKRLHYVQ